MRHEFYNGEVFAMAGRTRAHSKIITNLIGSLTNALQGRDCDVFEGSLKVGIEVLDKIVYPDVTVVCGPFEPYEENDQIILNPILIVEVLSKRTAGYDRGGKFIKYQKIPSLKEYVVVEQRHRQVDIFRKTDDGWGTFINYVEDSSTVFFESLQVEIPLTDIYHRVVFPTEDVGPIDG